MNFKIIESCKIVQSFELFIKSKFYGKYKENQKNKKTEKREKGFYKTK